MINGIFGILGLKKCHALSGLFWVGGQPRAAPWVEAPEY